MWVQPLPTAFLMDNTASTGTGMDERRESNSKKNNHTPRDITAAAARIRSLGTLFATELKRQCTTFFPST